MGATEAGLALVIVPLAYIVPVFLFIASAIHLVSGSRTFKRDIAIVLLTIGGTFATLSLILSQFTGNEDAELGGALFGLFFGVFAHLPALIIWFTCLSHRKKSFGRPEIAALVVVSPMILFLIYNVVIHLR